MKLTNLVSLYKKFLINISLLNIVILVVVKSFNTVTAQYSFNSFSNDRFNIKKFLTKNEILKTGIFSSSSAASTIPTIIMKDIPNSEFHDFIYRPFKFENEISELIDQTNKIELGKFSKSFKETAIIKKLLNKLHFKNNETPSKSDKKYVQNYVENKKINQQNITTRNQENKKLKWQRRFRRDNMNQLQHFEHAEHSEHQQQNPNYKINYDNINNKIEINFQKHNFSTKRYSHTIFFQQYVKNNIDFNHNRKAPPNKDLNIENYFSLQDYGRHNILFINISKSIVDNIVNIKFYNTSIKENVVDTNSSIQEIHYRPRREILRSNRKRQKYPSQSNNNVSIDKIIVQNNKVDEDNARYIRSRKSNQTIIFNSSEFTTQINFGEINNTHSYDKNFKQLKVKSRDIKDYNNSLSEELVSTNFTIGNCNNSNNNNSNNPTTDNLNCNNLITNSTIQATSLYGNNTYSLNNASFYDEIDEDCNLECDDCIPCNVTYEEYMQYLYDYIYPSRSEWILIATHCVVFITGLVGNALVCIAVYTNYSMRTVTNVYIVNLAIADFFVILICLPPSVVWDVTETWFLGKSMCKIVLYFQSISVTVSVLTLTFISVDRWYAICFPLRYRTKITRAVASVAFIWIVAVISDVPEFLALTLKPMNSKLRYETVLFTQCQTTWDIETEKNFYIVRLITLYILPLLLMTIAYFKIVRVLWKSETIPGHRESRNHHQYSTCGYSRGSQIPSASANTSTMGQLRARRKAAKMLVAVVIMFAVCYAPVHTFNLMRYTDTLPHNELTSIFSLLSHWLCYANSAINPIIYNFMSGKFRREFRNALEKCRCARVRVEDRSLNHSTPASRINNVSPGSRSNYQLTSVRDITRDISRQTMQTTFVENYGNGHSVAIPMLNNEKRDQVT